MTDEKQPAGRLAAVYIAASAASFLGMFAGFSCAPADSRISTPNAPSLHVTILHINDTHGHTQSRSVDGHGVGGFARLATLVRQIREENAGPVIFIHCGDELSRGDELTRRTLGLANFEILNAIGLDLFVPGNGEYYDGLPALKNLAGAARFPVIAANVCEKETGQPILGGSAVLQAGPIRIGVIGLSFVRSCPGEPKIESVSVADFSGRLNEMVAGLAGKTDMVIAATHIGLIDDLYLAVNTPGLSLIVGGHTHTPLPEGSWAPAPQGKKVLIAQAGEYMKFCGRIDLDFIRQPSGKYELAKTSARLIALDEKIPEDPAIKALIAKLDQSASRLASQPASAVAK